MKNNVDVRDQERDQEMEIDLMELFYRLLERAKYIIAAALVGAIVMAFYSFALATPTYEATSKLYVMNSTSSAVDLSALQIGSYLATDYMEVFETWEVQEMVMQNLGLDYTYEQLSKKISVTNPSNTRILYITASADSPKEATALANEFASVAKQYISTTMLTDEPTVFSEALEPLNPVSPSKGRNTILGFLLGAIAAIGVFTVQFILDDKLKTADDIRKYAGIATLAIVPKNGEGPKPQNTGKRGNR